MNFMSQLLYKQETSPWNWLDRKLARLQSWFLSSFQWHVFTFCIIFVQLEVISTQFMAIPVIGMM